MAEQKEILKRLTKMYGVDIYFYPNMSLGVDSPTFTYEISSIMELLEKLAITPSIENIFHIMEAKRKCIELFHSGILDESAKKYDEIVLKTSKPVGGIGPLEYFFATVFVCFLTFLYKYSAGFGEEAGKISARKLLNKEKEKAIDVINSSKNEIDFLEEEMIFLSKKGEDLEFISKTIRKIKN